MFPDVSTDPIPDLLTLVREMREKYPRPTRLAILVNPADVLPDRSLSEAVQEALRPSGDLIVGLPLIVSQGAPVGVPLLLDQGLAMESPHAAFLREITRRTDRTLSTLCGGWHTYDEFVPLDEWERRFAQRRPA